MSLAALAPHFGNEMEDSAMQEDHPADSAIAIDMESPKHHALTPQGTSYADSTAATTFWSHSQSQETADELVDVEFETAGAYEDDGMMAATEVEMTAAAPYEEDNELEMAYESGQPEFNYEVEDAEVRDAEDAYVEHSHEQHPASHFVPVEHEQPQETFPLPVLETGSFGPSDPLPLPLSEAVGDAGFPEEENRTEATPVEGGTLDPSDVDEHAEDFTGETHPSEGTVGVPTEATPVEDSAHEPAPESAEGNPVAPSLVDDSSQQTTEANVPEVPAGVVDVEGVVVGYDATLQEEEGEAETRYVVAPPPILLTTFSESSKSSVIALFNEPDIAMIPSSSKTASESPILLLDQHQHLFGEPVAVLLAQLRTELLHTEPEVLPASEFEYKEVQLIVRDLQLVLTEDNIYSREISLFDLESMHRSCGLSGYLHLDLSLQPRFIDRYRAIRQAIEAQGIVNNPDLAPYQEAREDEGKANTEDNTTATTGQHGRLDYEETVQGDQPPSKAKDGEGEGVPDGEEAEEPPLPLDDGASSWSEEQEDDGQEVTEEYQATEGHTENDWENTAENEVAVADEVPATEEAEEGVYEEEYLHEDDYVPGDLVRVDDEDFSADADEQLEEHAADEVSNEVNEATIENDYDDTETDANVTTAEVDNAASEEYPVHTDNTIDGAGEYKDDSATIPEEAEYVDDENEWDDLGYNVDAGTLQEDSALAQTASPHQVDSNLLHEAKTSNDSPEGNGAHAAHAELTPPQRKRSFSEVEAEPEGDLTLSPGSKKPRHL